MDSSQGSYSAEGSLSPGTEVKPCVDCTKSYKSCECKSCSKCGTVFQKYWGTSIVKGRSHCRLCNAAVCITCHMIINGTVKICTRCHIRQKEEEISTQKALSAIDNAKSGRSESVSSRKSEDQAYINIAGASRLSPEQKREALFAAAKAGDHYSLVTIINAGVDVNTRDADKNTPLFFAAEGGHLPCVAILMERGADVGAVNNKSWASLHALAWKGSTDGHVECAELLIQMGADIFALTNTQETAADLAARCGGKLELVQLLRAAEVDVAVQELQKRLASPSGFSPKETRWKLYIAAVVRRITETDGDSRESSTEKQDPVVRIHSPQLKTKSLDRSLLKSDSSPYSRIEGTATKLFGSTPTPNIPTADVEPIIRSDYNVVPTNTAKLEEKLRQCREEKEDLEQRCKRLMQSIAAAAEEHERELTQLQHDLDVLREQKQIALKRCEATYLNKMAKVRQEAEGSIHEINVRLQQAERDRKDVLHLQSSFRLTWVPDDLVSNCTNNKCRSPFTQTRRRHHCRCCGRVFCHVCTTQSVPIPVFGYGEPVRVCNPCYALVDEMFSEEPAAT